MPNGRIEAFVPTKLSESREEFIASRIAAGMSVEDAQISWNHARSCEYYTSDLYLVQLDRDPHGTFGQQALKTYALVVSRHDDQPINDWRDLQEIKNCFAGREVEAVELFPGKERLFDHQNRTVLFCFIGLTGSDKPRLPFGIERRSVSSEAFLPHCGQRPLPIAQINPKELTSEAS